MSEATVGDPDAGEAPEWADDLFDRKTEAALLTDYIESISERPLLSQDAKAHTIAIDAGYGEGKTFFLKRLAVSLERKHPVAFVDAWSDDLADEPLSALVATLHAALEPLLGKSEVLRSKWNGFLRKTGAVAKIAGIGALKRGLGLVFTSAAVSAAEGVLGSSEEYDSKDVEDAVSETINEAADETEKQLGIVSHKWMKSKIDSFTSGKEAMNELKSELSELINALKNQDRVPPIVIIIDELDRCRPSYSVKLLEEIKHLFDVPGLVFILGLHGEQLSKSIGATYGAEFDGKAYLRRFISRRYRLKSPDLSPLLKNLLAVSGIDLSRLVFPPAKLSKQGIIKHLDPHLLVASYMDAYGLSARDAVQFVDYLQTCAALTTDRPLLMGYLAPLISSKIVGAEKGELLPPKIHKNDLQFAIQSDYSETVNMMNIWPLAQNFKTVAVYSDRELTNRVNQNDAVAAMVLNITMNGQTQNNPLAHPGNYPDLLEAVGRFENPQITENAVG